jgi:hypothetical protein
VKQEKMAVNRRECSIERAIGTKYTMPGSLYPCISTLAIAMDSIPPFKPLTKEDIAEVFRVTPRTIENWVEQGDMPAPVRIGNRVFWHPDVFYGWLHELLRVSSALPAPERPAIAVNAVPKRRSTTDTARGQLRSQNVKRLATLGGSRTQPS